MRHALLAISMLATWTAGDALAQSVRTQGLRPVKGPLQRIVYDLETGSTLRLDAPPGSGAVRSEAGITGAAVSEASCFLNTRTMGFFSTGTTGTEWRDWATKSTGKTGLVTAFYFQYATNARDPRHLGGPGASIEVAFYAGETGFCRSSGVEIADSRFCFTGLPGFPGSLSSVDGFPFRVTAFVPANRSFCVPDGPIGWSFGFKDDDGSGEAVTGPVMTSFVSENTGAADAFDTYNRRPSATGTCLGTFFFNGCEPLPQPPPPVGMPCASFFIGLKEVVGSELASSSAWNPTLCNEDDYVSVADPVIGGGWSVAVDNTDLSGSGGDPNHDRVGLVVSLNAGQAGNLCYAGGFKGVFNGTALYARPPYLPGQSAQSVAFEGDGMTPAPASLRQFDVPVGKDLDLVGLRFCTMGYSLDFPQPLQNRFLSNALVVEVGTSR